MTKLMRIVLAFACMAAGPAMAASCAIVESIHLPGLEISQVQDVAEGNHSLPDFAYPLLLPAHCRVSAILTPSSDSRIEMEIWLPADNWNGRFLAVGNGGWAGSLSYEAMAGGLRSGYAVASNDTGHKNYTAAFAVGHPEKLIDFGYRAMHEMAINSKIIIEKFYDQSPSYSYFEGCSTGGRQGLMEAQRFPDDFDAIIAGAPVNNMFNVSAAQMSSMVGMLKDQSLYLPPDSIELLHNAVLDSCDADDGVVDGILSNPQSCNFEPESLLCDTSESNACLTTKQVMSVKQAYAPVLLSSGELVYPGHMYGFELGWRMLQTGDEPSKLQSDTFTYIAHQNPDWDWRTFDLDKDTLLALAQADAVSAVDPDLRAFKERGGKLLIYHGWNDPGPSPLNSIGYYQDVTAEMGTEPGDWFRLFMMPGMNHCRGGIGPDQADFLDAMVQWREYGEAPIRILSTKTVQGKVEMTRPLCPYPAVPEWDGIGDPNDDASFSCPVP